MRRWRFIPVAIVILVSLTACNPFHDNSLKMDISGSCVAEGVLTATYHGATPNGGVSLGSSDGKPAIAQIADASGSGFVIVPCNYVFDDRAVLSANKLTLTDSTTGNTTSVTPTVK